MRRQALEQGRGTTHLRFGSGTRSGAPSRRGRWQAGASPRRPSSGCSACSRRTGRGVLARRDHAPSSGRPSYVSDPRTVRRARAKHPRKIERDPGNPEHLVSVRGFGYQLLPGRRGLRNLHATHRRTFGGWDVACDADDQLRHGDAAPSPLMERAGRRVRIGGGRNGRGRMRHLEAGRLRAGPREARAHASRDPARAQRADLPRLGRASGRVPRRRDDLDGLAHDSCSSARHPASGGCSRSLASTAVSRSATRQSVDALSRRRTAAVQTDADPSRTRRASEPTWPMPSERRDDTGRTNASLRRGRMSTTPTTELIDLIEQNADTLLNDWVQNRSARPRAGRPPQQRDLAADSRSSSACFVETLRTASADDLETAGWSRVRDYLAQLSRRRAEAGVLARRRRRRSSSR